MSVEQNNIVESDAPHLFVAAAAGSGKTRVLVERYLRFVRQGISPDRMLTITFTKKAAAEMKRRIVDALMEEGLDREAQMAETGPIQTLHSFCERLLRENAVEAGLDPLFEITDERRKEALLSESVNRTLADCLVDEDPLVEELLESHAGKSAYGNRDPHSRLKSVIRELIRKLRGTQLRVEDVEAMASSPLELRNRWQATILSTLPESISAQVRVGDAFLEQLRVAYGKQKKPGWLKGVDTLTDAENTVAVLRLATTTWRRLDSEMIRTGQLDFTLLERLAVDLATTSQSVRDRMSRQFDAVFIDEAQDLNPLQYQLTQSLRTQHFMIVGDANQSIYAFRLADPELFIQHPEVHPATRFEINRNWRSGPGILSFVDEIFAQQWEGYRRMSVPEGVFLLDTAPRTSMEGVEVWLSSEPTHFDIASAIRAVTEDGHSPGDICVLARVTKSAIRIQEALERQGIAARVVGGNELYYTLLEVRDLANALRAMANPTDDFALLATLRSPFAGISLDAVILLAAPEEGRPQRVIDRLRTCAVPSVDRELLDGFLLWFEPLIHYADRLCAHEAVAELFAKSPFLPNLLRRPNGRQAVANARKLLSLAASTPSTSPEAFANDIQETASLKHRESEAEANDGGDSVTLMTIHKSKGLEFDFVVVADLYAKQREVKDNVVADPRLPMALVQLQVPSKRSIYDLFLREREHARQTQEAWRTAYVALTRAKKRLCVVCSTSHTPSIGRDITKLIGLKPDEPPEGLRVRMLGG